MEEALRKLTMKPKCRNLVKKINLLIKYECHLGLISPNTSENGDLIILEFKKMIDDVYEFIFLASSVDNDLIEVDDLKCGAFNSVLNNE